METAYNIENTSLAEHSLKRNIVPHAKRIENFAPLPWRAQPDSLWRHLPYSSVLQETETEMAFAKKCFLPPTFHLFLPRGFSSCYHLCLNRGDSSFEQDQDPSGQRGFSTDHRLKAVSLCQQLKTFPETSRCQSDSEPQQGSRHFAAEDVLPPPASNQPSVRFRFFCPDPLWQDDRRGRSWIQSSQKRGSFLPSFTLFRSSFQRFLAWPLKARKCIYLFWWSRVPKRMSEENSTGGLSCPGSSRFRFLRPQIYRASGPRGHWLYHRSQDDPPDQKENRQS